MGEKRGAENFIGGEGWATEMQRESVSRVVRVLHVTLQINFANSEQGLSLSMWSTK